MPVFSSYQGMRIMIAQSVKEPERPRMFSILTTNWTNFELNNSKEGILNEWKILSTRCGLSFSKTGEGVPAICVRFPTLITYIRDDIVS